jgi:hypothetical protein
VILYQLHYHSIVADGVTLEVSDAPINTTEIMKRSEIYCQFYVGSKLEVNKIVMEFKSALKIIEILKEDVDFVGLLRSANKSSK